MDTIARIAKLLEISEVEAVMLTRQIELDWEEATNNQILEAVFANL